MLNKYKSYTNCKNAENRTKIKNDKKCQRKKTNSKIPKNNHKNDKNEENSKQKNKNNKNDKLKQK